MQLNPLTVVEANISVNSIRARNGFEIVNHPRGLNVDVTAAVPSHLDGRCGRLQNGSGAVVTSLDEVTVDVENRLVTRPATKFHEGQGILVSPVVDLAVVLGQGNVATHVSESNAATPKVDALSFNASVGLHDDGTRASNCFERLRIERRSIQSANLEGCSVGTVASRCLEVGGTEEVQATRVDRKGGASFNRKLEATFGVITTSLIDVEARPHYVLVDLNGNVLVVYAAVPGSDLVQSFVSVVLRIGSSATNELLCQ